MANSNDLKLVFWSNGDPSVGIQATTIELQVVGIQRVDDDIKDLQSAICATISNWLGERVHTATEDELRQNNASENAYYERMQLNRRLPAGDFTEEMD
jgi:hypothetical protein